jgi:hypothetical protein
MDTLAATVFTTLGPRGRSLAFGKMKEILASLFVIGFCLFAWAALIAALLSLC